MYPTHDPATGLRVLVKQPAESRAYRMNFSDLMHYDALTSVMSVVSERQGVLPGSNELAIGAPSIIGPRVIFNLSGGTDGENYKVTAVVQDGGGNILEGEGMLYVRDL
jgi:hypothetical protein